MRGPQPGEQHRGEDDDDDSVVVVVPKVGAVLTFKNASSSRSEDARELERVFTSRGVKRASFLDVETTLGGGGVEWKCVVVVDDDDSAGTRGTLDD